MDLVFLSFLKGEYDSQPSRVFEILVVEIGVGFYDHSRVSMRYNFMSCPDMLLLSYQSSMSVFGDFLRG